MEHIVGDYRIPYAQADVDGVPAELFYKFKSNMPFLHLSNVLTAPEQTQLYHSAMLTYSRRSYARVHDYSQGVEASRVDTSGRYTLNIPGQPRDFELMQRVGNERIYPELKKLFEIDGNLVITEPWQFLGYGAGYFFAQHCDSCVPGSAAADPAYQHLTWWANTPGRKFTVLMYLNDQDNEYADLSSYSGGDLELCNVLKDGRPTVFNPKAGDVIAFPSNFLYTHEVKAVTRGFRICCVTWLNVLK